MFYIWSTWKIQNKPFTKYKQLLKFQRSLKNMLFLLLPSLATNVKDTTNSCNNNSFLFQQVFSFAEEVKHKKN